MKRWSIFIIILMCVSLFIACGDKSLKKINTIEGEYGSYHEMSDGTYQLDGYTYRYKLEISGRMPNAAVDSHFVYLSNIEEITFEQAWKAAGLSSNAKDYFDIKDAVLVEWN